MKKWLVGVFLILAISCMLCGEQWILRRLTFNGGASIEPKVAVNGAKVYVVFSDDTSSNSEIYFVMSSDYGNTWTPQLQLSTTAGASTTPNIAVNLAQIYVVWSDSTSGNKEIYFRKSGNGGSSWGSVINLSADAVDSYSPDIAVYGSTVYVSWHDWDDYKLYIRKSTNGGSSWQTVKSYTDTTYLEQTVAANSTSVMRICHTYWMADQTYIWVNRSINGGLTWPRKANVTSGYWHYIGGPSRKPSVAVRGTSYVYVGYEFIGVDDIGDPLTVHQMRLIRSLDGGRTWKPAQIIATHQGSSYYQPVAAVGSKVYAAWSDNASGNYQIYLRRSTNLGVSWGTPVLISATTTAGVSKVTGLAASSSVVTLVFQDDNVGNNEVYALSVTGY